MGHLKCLTLHKTHLLAQSVTEGVVISVLASSYVNLLRQNIHEKDTNHEVLMTGQ